VLALSQLAAALRHARWRSKQEDIVPPHSALSPWTVPLHRRPRRLSQSLSLVQLEATEGVEADDIVAEELYGTLYVGSPPQELTVTFDTGSGNILLPAKDCPSVACMSHKTYDPSKSVAAEAIANIREPHASLKTPERVRLSIGNGEVMGDLVVDQVCLNAARSVCARTGIVKLEEMSYEPFSLLPYDGVVGLGMPAASLDYRFDILGNMAEDGTLQDNRFAIWIATETDKDPSEITFGTFTQGRMVTDIVWLPVSRKDTGMWQTTIKDIYVDEVPLSICGKGGCQVAFDTGTAGIAAPTSVVKTMVAELGIKSGCVVGQGKRLGFAFGDDWLLNIDESDYVKHHGDKCQHQLVEVDMPPPRGPIIFLGDAFFRRYYTVFDRNALRVGVAFAKHTASPGGETSEQASQRLMVYTGSTTDE